MSPADGDAILLEHVADCIARIGRHTEGSKDRLEITAFRLVTRLDKANQPDVNRPRPASP